MTEPKEPPTYESEALAVLAFEFCSSQQSDSERKIKRRLRDKKLGPYDQARIDAIRAFKDDVFMEVSKATKSKFWLSSRGPYADLRDWNLQGLLFHFENNHPELPKKAIGRFLPYAIYLYYMR
jgi:hypothetical protein